MELHSDTDTSPIHRLEQTSTLTNTGAGPLRKASQVLSWEDSDLVALLRGRLESRYLPPPTLRSSTLLTMMIDLGTPKEITRDDVIRIALDIELIHKRAPIQLVNVDDNDLVSEAAEYGRRLLRYIREDSRCAALFNRAFGSRLSKIQFVPARIPIRVEHGAFVVFKQQLCCFNQLAAKQCGALVFCAKPVIDDDLSLLPHLYSFVGVMTDPTLDIVLAHLVKLTEQGESIDRWNNLQFSPEITFTAIFTFLFEHWKEIAMDKVAYLRSSAVIPVGHQLVPANRLFFKLVENLTPFMHEVPRVLGVHEEFLKLLKVRESPSVNDYTQFLAALAVECGDLSLNPNELRAVVTIIESIASLQIDNLSTNGDNFVNGLHLPDQNSILRPHASCIQNNDNWLKAQAGDRLMAHGLYIVHPWLPASAIKALYLPPISSILREVLLATNETSSLYVDEVLESMLQRFVRQLLSSDTVLNGLLELKLAESTTSGAFTTQEIEALLRQFSFRFVKSLPTTFIVLTSSLSLPPVALPTNATTTDSAVDTAAVISASNTSIPISKESQSLYFIQRIQDGGTVFVNLALLQPPLELITAVAAAVGDLLNLSHVFTATIAYLLSSTAHQQASVPSKREVDEQLNQIVTREPNDSQSVLTYLRLASDPVVMRERRRGMPGEKVSLCSRDLASLELKPFRLFQQGVTVAYAAPSESTTVSTDFRYGKVLIVGETSEEGIRRLIVKTGSNSSTQLLSSDVYTFKTTRDSKRQSQAIEERSRSPFSVLSRIAAPLMGNSTTRSSNGAALAETSLDHIATESGAQGGNTHSTAQQNDVLDALNTLLIRAGLGADINTQDLIKRAVDLSSSLRRTEKDLQEERYNSALIYTNRKLFVYFSFFNYV